MFFSFPDGTLSVNSLYFLALVSIISFSKSLRSDLKTFFEGSSVLSDNSWRVNSFPSVFSVLIIASSTLFNFIMATSIISSLFSLLSIVLFNFTVCKVLKWAALKAIEV